METKRGRGRPRKYPLCSTCQTSIKPDKPHTNCTPQEIVKQDDPPNEKAVPVSRPARGRPRRTSHHIKLPGSHDRGNCSEGYTAREAGDIISDTMNIRRYVVKYEGKFYATSDPEGGMAGTGYDSPTKLLGDFLRTTKFLRIGEHLITVH